MLENVEKMNENEWDEVMVMLNKLYKKEEVDEDEKYIIGVVVDSLKEYCMRWGVGRRYMMMGMMEVLICLVDYYNRN